MSNDSAYYKRTIERATLRSRALGEERKALVYLPPGYTEIASYPVIYCQDGEQFFQFGRIATQTNRLVLDFNLQPPIIVGVECDPATRTAEYHPEGERFSDYCAFFVRELVPYIESRYPVRREPKERILAGDSLGGAVSLHLALNEPKLFHRVISLSGAFYDATQRRIVRERDLSWLEMYMIVGLEETKVRTSHGTYDFLALNRETKRLLEQRNAIVAYQEKPGKHVWGFWQNEIPAALLYFLPGSGF
jgi:enterochelin esterase-like enzyme